MGGKLYSFGLTPLKSAYFALPVRHDFCAPLWGIKPEKIFEKIKIFSEKHLTKLGFCAILNTEGGD